MLPKQRATVRGHSVLLEVAWTAVERATGLMNRHEVPDGTGMLFVFEKPGMHSFWMKNTQVPLVVFWLDYTGKIVDRASLTPYDLTSVVPSVYASAAVEVPLTWAVKRRIGIGDRFLFT